MIIVSACGSSSGGAGDQGEVIKIGMVADLTGKSALTGEFKKNAALRLR